MLIAFKAARCGYFNGDPENVLKGRVDLVLGVLDYERYCNDYENKYFELNK
jgi:hypothetical protein